MFFEGSVMNFIVTNERVRFIIHLFISIDSFSIVDKSSIVDKRDFLLRLTFKRLNVFYEV